jgi:PAS domain S-box-containing protein
VESSHDAIVSKTPEGTVLTWNSGAESIYGYSAAEAAGREMTFLLPPDRHDEERNLLERIRQGRRVEPFETVRLRKDGRPIHVSLRIFPVYDSAGRIVAISHIARDMTERVQGEAAFEAQLRQTERRKLESVSALAAGIAHGFNNLLTVILGNACLLLEDADTGNLDRGALTSIIDSSQHAAHLTRQLLAYAGKGMVVLKAVDISDLVRSVGRMVQASIPKTVQLRLYLHERLPCVRADVGQIEQVIMNLILNAAEAIGEGTPGIVSVTTSVRQVDEQFLLTLPAPSPIAPGTYVEVEIHDSGCGMDGDTMSRIFEPFFSTKLMGRGLGLAAVQGIVREHKGLIRVNSEVGRGTTFGILFAAMNIESSRPAAPNNLPINAPYTLCRPSSRTPPSALP